MEKTIKRWDIINFLVEKFNYEKYLEIGVRRRGNFSKVKCEHKDGVDPNGHGNYKMTSDDFFKQNKETYDIVFIDGLHIDHQVNRDISNSLACLSENGIIVMHDCNPPTFKHQEVPRVQKAWNGTVWKSFVRLRIKAPNLWMCVVNADWGCGIIRKGKQKLYKEAPLKKCLEYDYFSKHRNELLNLISFKELVEMI